MTKKELVNLRSMSVPQMVLLGLFVLSDGSFWKATIRKIHDNVGNAYVVYTTPNSKVFLMYGVNGIKAMFSSAAGQAKTAFTAEEFRLAYPLYKGICESIAAVPFTELLQGIKAVDKPFEVLSTVELRLISKYNQAQFATIAAANAATVKATAAAVATVATGKLNKIALQRATQNARKRALRAALKK